MHGWVQGSAGEADGGLGFGECRSLAPPRGSLAVDAVAVAARSRWSGGHNASPSEKRPAPKKWTPRERLRVLAAAQGMSSEEP